MRTSTNKSERVPVLSTSPALSTHVIELLWVDPKTHNFLGVRNKTPNSKQLFV